MKYSLIYFLVIVTAPQVVAFDKEKLKKDVQICFDIEINLFEQNRGQLPTDDEVDLIIDYCVNKKYEKK